MPRQRGLCNRKALDTKPSQRMTRIEGKVGHVGEVRIWGHRGMAGPSNKPSWCTASAKTK